LQFSVGRLTQLKRSNSHFASSSRPSPPFAFVEPPNAVLQQKTVTFQVISCINDFFYYVGCSIKRIFEYIAGQRSSKQRQAPRLVVLDTIDQNTYIEDFCAQKASIERLLPENGVGWSIGVLKQPDERLSLPNGRFGEQPFVFPS